MIDFSGYTQKKIQTDMLAKVPNSFDKRQGSLIQVSLAPVAWTLEGFYMFLAQVQENAYADTAVGQALDYICAERGIYRKKAIPAVREGIFNVPVPEGAAFKTVNGAESVIFTAGKLRAGSEGNYIYEMVCQTSGIAGNFYAGNLLPITSVRGLTQARIGQILISGEKEEEDEPLRKRYQETFEVAAFGGNIPAYRSAVLAMEGVGAVQVYPVWAGGGTVLISILNSRLGPADPGLVEKVQNEICPPEEGESNPSANGYGMAPIGARVTVVSATELPLNISCKIQRSDLSMAVSSYQGAVEQKIGDYIDTICETWGKPLRSYRVEYPVTVYVSRIIASILSVSGIVNVTEVEINGAAEDLVLTETAQLQQIPVLGTVTIDE